MRSQFILALDQGTTSSRAIVFDHQARALGVGQHEFRQYFPSPGLVEHDLEEIWQSQCAAMQDAVSQAEVSAQQITAIGITNQRETIAIWDKKSGQPLFHALVWQDKRTTSLMQELADQAELIHAKSGLLPDPYFSASKLKWLLDNVDQARALADQGRLAAGTIDTWLIYKLTGGEQITDIGNASRTLLFNIHTLKWDEDLMQLFDIPSGILPQVVPSAGQHARTAKTLLGASIPIAGIAGDQHAALFGQNCVQPGMVKNTYGTGCFMLMNTGTAPIKSKHNLLTTIVWQLPDAKPVYALEGSIFVGGSAIQWLRDGLGLIKEADAINQLAADDNGGVYFVPALVGLGAPHWDPKARGLLIGITRGTQASHLARAVLESIAFQTVELAQAMQQDCGFTFEAMRADGGATASARLMQIQADLLGVPVQVPQVRETTALGCAYLAGLAAGVWDSQDQIAKHWQLAHSYEPTQEPDEREGLLKQWRAAVERSKDWAS